MAHGRGRFAKKIDTVHWTLVQEASIGLGSGGTAGFTAGAAQHLPETLMRIRGEWSASISLAIADAVGVVVTAGLILVPEGTGTTVLWSPNADGDAPWIWWDCFNLIYTELVTDVIASQPFRSRVMDSKAMRKVRNQEVQFVVENATITGLTGSSVDTSMTARVLSGT